VGGAGRGGTGGYLAQPLRRLRRHLPINGEEYPELSPSGRYAATSQLRGEEWPLRRLCRHLPINGEELAS